MFFQDFVLDVMVKATVLLLAVLLADYVFQKNTSAGVRHRLWAATFVALLLLPLLSATMPRWRLAILPAQWGQLGEPNTQPSPVSEGVESEPLPESVAPSLDVRRLETHTSDIESSALSQDGMEATAHTESAIIAEPSMRNDESAAKLPKPITSTLMDWPVTMALLFAAGFTAAIAPLLLGLLRNASLGRNAKVLEEQEDQVVLHELCQRLAIARSVKLLKTEQSIVPMTWGIFKPVVIVPSQWRQWLTENRRLVLLHELAHVKRLDVVYQCLARLACAVFWFHPLVWYALRRLRIERELACDDCVIMAGERPSSYAKQLLDIAREYQSLALPPAVAMAQHSGLEQRVRALLDKARSHVPISPRVAQVLLLGSLVTVTLLAAVQVEAIADRPLDGELAESVSQDLLSITGLVLGPDGQPVEGARVVALREYLANTSWKKSYEELSETLSGEDGSYAIQVPQLSERFSDGSNLEVQSTHVLVSKPGFGPDQRLVAEAGATDLKLAKAEKAIEGQVVDLEGYPMPGIKVRVTEIRVASSPLDAWLEQAAKNPATYSDEMRMGAMGSADMPKLAVFPQDHTIAAMDSLTFPVVETESNGAFKVTGIGDEREVTLRLDGDAISSTLLKAVTREMPAVNMPMYGNPTYRVGKTFGAKFVVSAEPAQIIRGRITDRESHEPIVGATVRLVSYADNFWALGDFLTTRTDERGEYVLAGVPKASENSRGVRIGVMPPQDMPYFDFDEVLPKVASLETIEFDIQLTRGIWIEGQAIDGTSGQPIRGTAAYYPSLENEHAKSHEAFDRRMHTVGYGDGRATDQQGRFRIPALPGAGAVRFVAEAADKYELEGPSWGSKEQAGDPWKLYHIMMPGNAMVRVELPIDPKVARVDIALSPSPVKRFRVVDQTGNPITGYEVGGQFPTERPTISGRGAQYWGEPQDESTIDVVLGDDEKNDRPLMFFHRERELAALIDAKAWQLDESGIVTVTLLPCAKLIGQLIFPDGMDSAGHLVAGYGAIEEIGYNTFFGGDGKALTSPPRKHLKYQLGNKTSYEKDGSFSLIIPASKNTSVYYGGGSIETAILDGVTLTPGQVLDLGKIEMDKHDSNSKELNVGGPR